MAMSGGRAIIADGDVIEDVVEPVAAPVQPVAAGNVSAQADALSALGNLGYAPGDAAVAVAEAGGQMPDADAAALIRAALKLLAPKN